MEQPGDETQAQRTEREATIEAIQTRHALTPTKDTSNMLRLSLEESACLRSHSPDRSFVRFMNAVRERDLNATKALVSCLTRESALVLLLMNDAGVAPDLSEETWACMDRQTAGIDLNSALGVKHGLDPENSQTLDAFSLAGTGPMAMLICVTDEEYAQNEPRLGADEATRQALRCLSEKTGGILAMIDASESNDVAARATYEEQVAECTGKTEATHAPEDGRSP